MLSSVSDRAKLFAKTFSKNSNLVDSGISLPAFPSWTILEESMAKNCYPVSLLSVVSKVFEKLVNDKLVDHVKKYGCLSDFQCGFRSSRLTTGLLTIVSDKIARVFNRSGATRAVALEGF